MSMFAFELMPEGQALNDYKVQPLLEDDLSTPFFTGTLSSLPRGFIKGAMGLPETVASGYAHIIDLMLPDADTVSDDEFLSFSYALKRSASERLKGFVSNVEETKEIIKPDAFAQGTAAQVLGGLGEFVPSMVATAAYSPLFGAGHAFGSSYESVNQDMLKQGVDSVTARKLAITQSATNAVGMALPAAIGNTATKTIASGIGINVGFGMVSRYSSSKILENNGYKDMASQYKVWDKQAIIIDGVLGSAFGYMHSLSSPKRAAEKQPVTNNVVTESTNTSVADKTAAQISDRGLDYVHAIAEKRAIDEVINNVVPELELLSSKKLADRISTEKELHNINYQLSEKNLNKVYDNFVDSFRSNKVSGKTAKTKAKKELEKYKTELLAQKEELQNQLDAHKKANQARNDLSVIKKDRIPDRLKDSIKERTEQIANEIINNPDLMAEVNSRLNSVKASDIDAAHTLNEGLNHDLYSSPTIHSSPKSLSSHAAAMEKATNQMLNSESVNVHQEVQGLDGVINPEIAKLGMDYSKGIEKVFKENGIDYSTPRIEQQNIPEPTLRSSFNEISEYADIHKNTETGEIISSNSYELSSAKDIASSNPDLPIIHPDTGEVVPLGQLLSDLDEQIVTAKKESKVFDVAIQCFLRNG